MGRRYIRNEGANPPGSPGKPVLGVTLTDRTGNASLYMLKGFRGTRRTYHALRDWDKERRKIEHYKAPDALAEAVAVHGISGTICQEDGVIYLDTSGRQDLR